MDEAKYQEFLRAVRERAARDMAAQDLMSRFALGAVMELSARLGRGTTKFGYSADGTGFIPGATESISRTSMQFAVQINFRSEAEEPIHDAVLRFSIKLDGQMFEIVSLDTDDWVRIPGVEFKPDSFPKLWALIEGALSAHVEQYCSE